MQGFHIIEMECRQINLFLKAIEFKLNNVLKYELHSADENVKALHRVGTVCRREWQK